MARKQRLNGLSDRIFRSLKREFERDWNSIHRLPVDEASVRRAGELAEQYELRGYDSLHLAACEIPQRAVHAPVTFACFDRDLNEAARELGMEVLGTT